MPLDLDFAFFPLRGGGAQGLRVHVLAICDESSRHCAVSLMLVPLGQAAASFSASIWHRSSCCLSCARQSAVSAAAMLAPIRRLPASSRATHRNVMEVSVIASS